MKKFCQYCCLCLLLLATGRLEIRAQSQAPAIQQQEINIDLAQASQAVAGKERLFTLKVPLVKAEPFLAVGLAWPAVTGHIDFSLRSSSDGVVWSDWLQLTADADAQNERNELVSGLTLLPSATRFIQCRYEMMAVPVNSSMRVIFISPGATPRGWQEQIQAKAQSTTMSQQQPLKYPKPPIVTRTEWGCPDGQITTHGTLSYTTVTHLIVHHTATGNTAGNDDWAAVVRTIWNFHVFTNGWADLGYNYLIDPNGVIYEGRAGGDNVIGAHFSGTNSGTLGVSMIGTFTNIAPSDSAFNSLRRILAWKADQRSIDPTGKSRHAASGLELNNISGHRDGPGTTECPGNALYPLLPSVRAGVKELLSGATALASVSAASFAGDTLASDSIVAAFGIELAASVQSAATTPLPLKLAGTTVTVRDSTNKDFVAPLFFVAPGQINFLMPPGLATGPATVLVTNSAGKLASSTVNLAPVAPALFAANANGRGVPAAVLLRIKANGTQVYEPVAIQVNAQFTELPLDLADENEQVFLIAFGTGIRQRHTLDAVTAKVSDVAVPVLFAGAVDGLAGLDQINVRLPYALKGRGSVDFTVTVEGKAANVLRIRIK